MNTRRAFGHILVFAIVFSLVAAIPQLVLAQTSKGIELYNQGLSYLSQEKYKDALDAFLKIKNGPAEKTNPNECQIQIALARARLGLKQYDEAWKNLEAARRENAGSSEVYLYRGVFYFQQEKYREARSELDKAISLNKNEAYAYYYEGLAHYHLGEAANAVEDLKTFVGLEPDAPEVEKATLLIKQLC
jgi:tetratricopeptide (TPR) repeat protein